VSNGSLRIAATRTTELNRTGPYRWVDISAEWAAQVAHSPDNAKAPAKASRRNNTYGAYGIRVHQDLSRPGRSVVAHVCRCHRTEQRVHRAGEGDSDIREAVARGYTNRTATGIGGG
jgi:hypothetical protein